MTQRNLDTATLDLAGHDYAFMYAADRGQFDRRFVMRQFQKFAFKDEFNYLIDAVRGELGSRPRQAFDLEIDALMKAAPRDDAILAQQLLARLAVDQAGQHVDGHVGLVQIDRRPMGAKLVEVEPTWSIRRRKAMIAMGRDPGPRETIQRLIADWWPVYAGETEERLAGSAAVDPLPENVQGMPVGALNTRIANVLAIDMADAAVDRLDEGSLGAVIQGRDAAQPAGVDVVVAGTNLFTLTCSTTAFGAAGDGAPGGLATAAAITADTSADATGTVLYCRASSSSVADTPLDDLIDGEAGTSGADFNFNTVAIVALAQVDMTAWTVTQPES